MDIKFSKTSKEKANPVQFFSSSEIFIPCADRAEKKSSYKGLKVIVLKGRFSYNTVNKILSLYFHVVGWFGQEYCIE